MDNKSKKNAAGCFGWIVLGLFLFTIVGGFIQSVQAFSQFFKENPWLTKVGGVMTQFLNDHGAIFLISSILIYGWFVFLDPDRPKPLNWFYAHIRSISFGARDGLRYRASNRFGIVAIQDLLVSRILTDSKVAARILEMHAYGFGNELSSTFRAEIRKFFHPNPAIERLSEVDMRQLSKAVLGELFARAIGGQDLKITSTKWGNWSYRYDFERWAKREKLPHLRGWEEIPSFTL